MEHRFLSGIDLDDQYAVISSYELNKKKNRRPFLRLQGAKSIRFRR